MNVHYVIFCFDKDQGSRFAFNSLMLDSIGETFTLVDGTNPQDGEGWTLLQGVVFILLPGWFCDKSPEYVLAVSKCEGMPRISK